MLFSEAGNEPEIIIEDKVLIGSGVHLYVPNHEYTKRDVPIYDQDISAKEILLVS